MLLLHFYLPLMYKLICIIHPRQPEHVRVLSHLISDV